MWKIHTVKLKVIVKPILKGKLLKIPKNSFFKGAQSKIFRFLDKLMENMLSQNENWYGFLVVFMGKNDNIKEKNMCVAFC